MAWGPRHWEPTLNNEVTLKKTGGGGGDSYDLRAILTGNYANDL